MNKEPLGTLFTAVHRSKYPLSDFLHGDIFRYTTANMKGRTIYRPDKRLKVFLNFLNAFLFEHLEINDQVVYSYRKGRNPYQAVSVHSSSRAFFQTDIENFFGSIDKALIRATIFPQICRVPISDLPNQLNRILDLITINDVLPVGFPTSPLISNACLTPFDNALYDYCNNSNLIYTRYADDLVISGRNREIFQDVGNKVSELLEHHFSGRLKVNIAKQKLTTVGRKIKILGMVILPNGQVTIDNELRKRVEVLLYFYLRNRDAFLDMVDGDFDAGTRRISGYITYINASDQSYLEKLKRKFGVTVIDSFLHRSAL